MQQPRVCVTIGIQRNVRRDCVMKSRYVWIDGTWIKGLDGRPRVVLFGRDYDDPMKTRTIAVKGFNPYFYVNISAEVSKLPEIQGVEGPFEDALGRKVKKIIVNLPSDVPKVRKHFEWTDEADILFDVRFVVDAGIKYAFDDKVQPVEVDKPLQPRIMYLDIEVKAPEEVMPKPEKPEWSIVTIQTLDSYTGDLKVFALDVPSQADDAVVSCQTERELLLRFADYVQRVDPDVLTGWFSSGFDLPYLIIRARRLAVPLDKLTRLPGRSYPRTNQLRAGGWSVRIVGRQCVDMLEAFKKWHKAKGELETYDLKFVAKKFAGFEYEDYGDSIDRLYREQDWETLIDYCKNDVLALRAIDQAIGLFEFYEYIRFVVGCKLEDTMKNSKIIEMLLMRAGIKPMPTRRYDRIDEEDRYTGALVLQPPLGVHEWVGVFDLASLYPSIIMAFDVSPDVDKMIPKVITTVLQERERLRKLRLEGRADEVTKMKEVVLKFLANSFYGVLGWPGFRLYSREHAEFITTKGREINMFLQQCARERGYTAIYGDSVDPESPVFILEDGFVKIIPIDEVKEGDYIWTGWSWQRVKRVIIKPKRKKMYRVVTRSGIVDVTEDHSLIQDGEPVRPMEATKVDYVPFPEVQETVDDIDTETAWLIGFFLAEGSRIGRMQYVINNQDVKLLQRCQEIIKRLCGRTCEIRNFMKSSRCHRLSIPHELNWLFDECYSKKGRKIVPWFVLNHESEGVLRAFIDGFYAGDGSNEKRYREKWKRIDQRSPLLAVGLQFVLERLGYIVSVKPAGSNKMSWGLRIGHYRRKDPEEITHVFEIETKYDYVVDIGVEHDHVFAVGHLLLHNTDSIFVKGVKTPEQGLELQDYFNERLEEWAQNVGAKIPPRIKFEKLFRRIMFKRKIGSEEAAKKRYAGWLIWEDGHEVDEIKIVGMETRRSDVAEITKELMGQFLELVLKQGDIDAAGRLIRQTLRAFDRLPLQKVAIPKGVTKDLGDYKSESAWIVGIRNAQQLLGLRFRQDRKPRLLYLKRPVKRLCITEDVEKLPDDFEVDWEVMKEKTIVQKFRPLVESLGLSWEVVVEGQTTLDSWW